MPRRTGFRVLFAAAAGPSIGFGHLVRCRSLARALGVAPVVVVRGTAATRQRAAAGDWRLAAVEDDDDLRRLNPQVVVVDDPSIKAVTRWVRCARRVGVPVATIHDVGIAVVESDLVIDGSVHSPHRIDGRLGSLRGPVYAILDPRVRATRERLTPPVPRSILIALGGGRRSTVAARLARAITERVGDVDIRVAGGFTAGRRMPALANGKWIYAPDGLADELSTTSVAVLAGGVTLYEACALGVPSVAVALNPSQHVTIRAMARRGVTVDAGSVATGSSRVVRVASGFSRSARVASGFIRSARVASGSSRSARVASGFSRKRTVSDRERTIARVAREVERLLGDAASRKRMAVAGRRLVDARGAARVAARLRQLPAAVAQTMGHVA